VTDIKIGYCVCVENNLMLSFFGDYNGAWFCHKEETIHLRKLVTEELIETVLNHEEIHALMMRDENEGLDNLIKLLAQIHEINPLIMMAENGFIDEKYWRYRECAKSN